jgi:long-subunit acyl-CoA synthetase (AMP-forming)
MRHSLRHRLSPFLRHDGLILEEGLLVCVLAPANYEFAVAAFSILALGGTIVALRMQECRNAGMPRIMQEQETRAH